MLKPPKRKYFGQHCVKAAIKSCVCFALAIFCNISQKKAPRNPHVIFVRCCHCGLYKIPQTCGKAIRNPVSQYRIFGVLSNQKRMRGRLPQKEACACKCKRRLLNSKGNPLIFSSQVFEVRSSIQKGRGRSKYLVYNFHVEGQQFHTHFFQSTQK